MKESKIQLGPDTWAYMDTTRSKLIIEIDIPKKEDSLEKPLENQGDIPKEPRNPREK